MGEMNQSVLEFYKVIELSEQIDYKVSRYLKSSQNCPDGIGWLVGEERERKRE